MLADYSRIGESRVTARCDVQPQISCRVGCLRNKVSLVLPCQQALFGKCNVFGLSILHHQQAIMSNRMHATPMDFQYENGTGPLDERSPFAQVGRNSLRNNAASINDKKREFSFSARV